jgi:putative flippase GtrA
VIGEGRRFARFTAAGAVGWVVDVGMLYVLLWLGLGYYAGRIGSFLGAVSVTWYINRHITFRPGAGASVGREWWTYLLAMLPGGAVNYACYSAIVALLPEGTFVPAFAVTAGAVLGLVVNFAMAKGWVYRGASKGSAR